MIKGMVSVIVTCYNQEHCIKQTLDSVQHQTYTNWECVIIDDGSVDKSAERIKAFIKNDKRYTYLFQDNQGVSKARNKGFASAKGEFVNFLDGDDTLFPRKIEKQREGSKSIFIKPSNIKRFRRIYGASIRQQGIFRLCN
jgi:hypothetical protein